MSKLDFRKHDEKRNEYIYSYLNQHLEKAREHGNPLMVSLYGSQNYDLDTEASDIDSKATMLPSLRELLERKQLSEVIVGDVDGGLCDLKHIDLMCRNFKKGNINFLETLYGPFVAGKTIYLPYIHELRNARDFIAKADVCKVAHAATGMADQKLHALKHPYESKIPVLEEYGYDPKQLASLLRLEYFMEMWMKDCKFYDCIHPCGEMKNIILRVKSGEYSENEATLMAYESMDRVRNFAYCIDKAQEGKETKETEVEKFLSDWAYKVCEAAIREESLSLLK